MKQFPYKRIDLDKLPELEPEEDGAFARSTSERVVTDHRVRLWIIPLCVLLCCLQASVYISIKNLSGIILTSTLIPVAGFGILFALTLLINPCISIFGRNGRSRCLNRIELVCLFSALMVTAGFSTWGPASHLVPLIASPWNPEWNTPQRGWEESLTHPETPVLNPRMYIRDPESIRVFREGVLVRSPQEGATISQRFEYHVSVFGAIPWHDWAIPVGIWLIYIFGCYGIFYSLAYVVLGYWSDREKLTFPLAQLPLAIMANDTDRGRLPAIFHRPTFWAGFAVSGLILSWNGAIGAGWLVPDFRISLGLGAAQLSSLTEGTILEGLGGYSRLLIIFTAIGVAFLLPKQISFSIWGYSMFSQFLILVAVWIGLGESWADFPFDGRSVSSFLTAQGGGALLTFAAISVYRCLREYWFLTRGKSVIEGARLAVPVLWLMFSVSVVVIWLLWNQIPFLHAILFVLILSLMSIGIMRIVAETSMYWFAGTFGFFHVSQALGFGKIASSLVLAPLMPIYSIFLSGASATTFVAPSILNAAKIQKDTGQSSRTFHLNLILCIILSILFALAFTIYFVHMHGAQQSHGWLYNTAPQLTLDAALDMARGAHDTFSSATVWVIFGAGWLVLSLWIRRSQFWFPHPIGYILLFSPIVRLLFFSFLIGWFAKAVTVKYGGKSTFHIVKLFFIGLVFGEILAVFVWGMLGLALDFQPGVGFHRFGP